MRERILLIGNINDVSDKLKEMLAKYGDDTIGWIAPVVRFNIECDKLIVAIHKAMISRGTR